MLAAGRAVRRTAVAASAQWRSLSAAAPRLTGEARSRELAALTAKGWKEVWKCTTKKQWRNALWLLDKAYSVHCFALCAVCRMLQVASRDAISKTFMFRDFKQAWSFMSKTAEYADQVDHHPEWFNVYNKVEVTLSTHDSSGVTRKDVDLATRMEAYAADATK